MEDYEIIFQGDDRELAVVYSNLAEAYAGYDQLDSAQKYFQESTEMYRRLFDGNHQEYFLTLSDLAGVYAKIGLKEESEKMLVESYQGLSKLAGDKDQSVIRTKRQHAFTQYFLGKKSEAYRVLRATAQVNQDYIEDYFDYLSEPARVAFYSKYVPFFNTHTSWIIKEHESHPELVSDLLNIQLRNKALLLNTSNRIKKRIMESGDRKLIGLYDDAQLLRQRLGTMSSMTREQAMEKYNLDKDSLQLVYEAKDRELNQLSSLYANNNKPPKWEDIQVKLNKGEALIEIVRYNIFDFNKWEISDSVQYVALIVTPKTREHPKLVFLNEGNLLEDKGFKQYQNSIRYKQEDNKSYDVFWAPLKPALKGVKKAYLSLDGVYHKVNLKALKNPGKGSYVMDEIDIHLITSGRDLLQADVKMLPLKLGLLIGNPDFGEFSGNQDNELRGFEQLLISGERSGLAPLPGAEIEVKTVQEIFQNNGWKEITLLNEEAEERVLKEMLKPNVLHIATHGFFQPDNYKLGKNKHPLFRSGLLLSGAAQTLSGDDDFQLGTEGREDGILTSFEAMNLNIDNTNLVVLSACETGLGDIVNGEGVYGLQRAFKIAGARTIIMSLWKVDDSATQELMVSFYENWLKHQMTKRDALISAQNKLKEKYPHPYYWGAFVLLGE